MLHKSLEQEEYPDYGVDLEAVLRSEVISCGCSADMRYVELIKISFLINLHISKVLMRSFSRLKGTNMEVRVVVWVSL